MFVLMWNLHYSESKKKAEESADMELKKEPRK